MPCSCCCCYNLLRRSSSNSNRSNMTKLHSSSMRIGPKRVDCISVIYNTFLLHVCITYWNNVTATFRFRLLLRRNFLTSQLRYLFVRMISFFDDVIITLNYRNCWNVWIVYGSYVIKWSYISYIIFLSSPTFWQCWYFWYG